MKAVAYDPATETIRICKLKRAANGEVIMTEAHEDVTVMCVRAVLEMIASKGPVPLSHDSKGYVLAIVPLEGEKEEP